MPAKAKSSLFVIETFQGIIQHVKIPATMIGMAAETLIYRRDLSMCPCLFLNLHSDPLMTFQAKFILGCF